MIIQAPTVHVGDDNPWEFYVKDTHDQLAFNFALTTVRLIYVTSLNPATVTTEIAPETPPVHTRSFAFTLKTDGTDGYISVASVKTALTATGPHWVRILCDPAGGGSISTGAGIVRSDWTKFQVLP